MKKTIIAYIIFVSSIGFYTKCFGLNDISPPMVEFSQDSFELNDSAKLLLDGLYPLISNQSVLLINHPCLCEYFNDEFIGVKRAQKIIDYLEQKGMSRQKIYILDSRLMDIKQRSLYLNEIKKDGKCYEKIGIFVEIYKP